MNFLPDQLFTCPRCNRTGFYAKGLVMHVCRGTKLLDSRRRLNCSELITAGIRTEAAPLAQTKQGGAR